MALRPFQRWPVEGDGDLDNVQDAVENYVEQLTPKLFLDHVILQGTNNAGIGLSATVTNVEHGLGRSYIGWLVVDSDANETIYRDSSSTLSKAQFLPLLASGAVTVKLLVF